MARMIPPILPENTPSPGEKEVYRRLRQDPDTEGWTVLHSLDTAQHVKQVFGEIDFVIIVPHKGVLCLEIKGTTHLKREHGVWYYGNSAPDARGPFKQAAQSMHSLRKYVAERTPELNSLVFWSAVGFPFVNFNETSPEWHSWQVIDRRAMASLSISKLIVRVLDNARKFLANRPTARWFDPRASEPQPDQCEALVQLLRPEFELYESPKSRAHRLNEELKRYTIEQFNALDAMEQNSRVAFTGPAGTGKTLLALEAARRASAEGKKVLLVCFNRLLGKTLEIQAKSLEGVTARTLHAYMLSIADVSPEHNRGNPFWTKELPTLVLEKLLSTETPTQFDTLIVDEAQDILREPYLDVLDLSLKEGLAGGHWRIFGDFERQQIYSSTNQMALEAFLSGRSGSAPSYSLRTNCRNTPRIATSAQWLGQLSPGYIRVLRPDDGVNVEYVYYESWFQQIGLLSQTLENLYSNGFRSSDIIVLSPNANGKACASSLTTPPWSYRLKPYRLDLDRQEIGYCSIHAFKGLEASAVVVTDIEHVIGDEASQLFYTAITRALHHVVILASLSAKSDIESILLKGLRSRA